MKKILLILCCLCMICGCTSSSDGKMKKSSAEEIMKLLQREGSNNFLLVLTTSNCYSCDEYEKVIEQLEEEKEFLIYYINVDNENKNKMDELRITIGDYTTLPMTYYFEAGTLKPENIKSNYIELETYRAWLKELGIF